MIIYSDSIWSQNEPLIAHEPHSLVPNLSPPSSHTATHEGRWTADWTLNNSRSSETPAHNLSATDEPIVTRPPIISIPVTTQCSDDQVYNCEHTSCVGKTFGRRYELERHYNSIHAVDPTVFWCTVVGCKRSAAECGRPFRRKDKRNDHMRKIHGL